MFRSLKTYQLIVDLVVAGLFAVFALPVELRGGGFFPFNALAAVLMVTGFAGALAVRRLSPGLSLGLAWTAAIIQMAFGREPSFTDVAVFAVLYNISVKITGGMLVGFTNH